MVDLLWQIRYKLIINVKNNNGIRETQERGRMYRNCIVVYNNSNQYIYNNDNAVSRYML